MTYITYTLFILTVERYQLNDLSAYVDGGNIYGTTLIKSNALRSFVDGKLKISVSYKFDSISIQSVDSFR